MTQKSRVQDLIGVCENELVEMEDRNKFITEEEETDDGVQCFTNSFGEEIPIGDFGIFGVKELEDLLVEVGMNKRKSYCRLSVMKNVDIGHLQGNIKTSDRAMVQVASNFNCLEVGGRNSWPDMGYLVDLMHEDSTQGPAACFGPLAATLYRTHFVFQNYVEGKVKYSGQTRYKQINLLEDASDYLGTPINGKLNLRGDEKFINDIDKTASLIKVGLHTDARVIYGRDSMSSSYKLSQPYQSIDQCFTASINLNAYGNRTSKDRLISVTRSCLRAAYEGTYLAAILRKRKVLYLTLVGAGSFSNPIPAVMAELMAAHKKWANHQKSQLEKVIICQYDNSDTIEKCIKQHGF